MLWRDRGETTGGLNREGTDEEGEEGTKGRDDTKRTSEKSYGNLLP